MKPYRENEWKSAVSCVANSLEHARKLLEWYDKSYRDARYEMDLRSETGVYRLYIRYV